MVNNVEASKILKIMSWADGGCAYCASDLFKGFIKEFGFKDLAVKYYRDIFDGELFPDDAEYAKDNNVGLGETEAQK